MVKRFMSPWLQLKPKYGEEIWITSEHNLFACDTFWEDFDWNRPEPGYEMRFVFSGFEVKGASKLLVSSDGDGSFLFVLDNGEFLGTYIEMDNLLSKIKSPDILEFYVWWWPEYREGTE